jgi:RimJ/RimL family protein N-acetyltransferase
LIGIQITETDDRELIREIVTDPDIYPHVTDDLSVSPEKYIPQFGEHIHWLLIRDGYGVCGCFMVHRLNAAQYECHTCILKGHRGMKAVEAAISAVSFVFNNYPCDTLITHVPEYNLAAYRLAESAGFTRIGTIPDGWRKNGELQPLHILGVQRCQ